MLASIRKTSLSNTYRSVSAAVLFLCLTLLISVLMPALQANAFSPNYDPNNLIDNPTFTNSSSMGPGQIQALLSAEGSGLAGYSDVEACSGTIAPYYSHCGQALSAAQLIYDAAQAYGISPRTILATLEKEQSLVTDPTPSASQINCAMGYNSCTGYVGFFTQVDNGAWILRYNYEGAAGHANWLSWHPASGYPCSHAGYVNNGQTRVYSTGLYPGNTVVFDNPGGSPRTVVIANAATASLYCYTPYVGPYSATGYSGSYNFVYYFQLWFGATQTSTPFAWAYEGQWAYSDAARTQQFSSTPTVAPGGKIYVTLKARNVGYQTWNQSFMHLGTSRPQDRASTSADGTWLSNSRPAQLLESSVAPGDQGTFQFEMQAPNTAGTYTEYFNPLAEGQAWLNDLGFCVTMNVNTAASANNSNNSVLNSGQTLNKGATLLSPDSQSTLTLQSDGNLALYSDFNIFWETGAGNNTATHLVMQTDGNMVLYSNSNVALWSSQTQGNPGARLVLQTDGNMVIYSTSNVPLWASYTVHNPDHLSFVNTGITPGMTAARLYPGQSIDTADRRYHLVLQGDGNLVLYSPSHALWASSTDGKQVSFLAMQLDGNLVLYDTSGRPLWYSGTAGQPNLHLVIQQDGNLVLYNSAAQPSWNTATAGKN